MPHLRMLTAAVALLLWAGPAAAALPIPPPPDHRVNDYAGALSPAERDRLEDKLRQRERASSNQVVVAIFRSLQGESLEDYSIRLAQNWRVGQKGLDNGVVFLVFLEDRKMRIEVGYGLEANLTDAISSSILRDVVAPRFREGRLADGLAAGLDAIDQAIAGTYKGPAPPRQQQGPDLFYVFVALIVLASIASVVVPAMSVSNATRRHGWTGGSSGWGGPYVGGGFFGGGGGGGGGGDFSGGGGDFGGGGSSGGW